MITQDQLKDVLDRTDALYRYLKIDEKKMEYEEEDLRTQAPDFWEDQKIFVRRLPTSGKTRSVPRSR